MAEHCSSATVVFVGHHQSGKSTALGHLLLKSGSLDRRFVERTERETSNRPASRFAWLVDRLRPEREKGLTVDLKICRTRLTPQQAAAAAAAATAAAADGSAGAAAHGNGNGTAVDGGGGGLTSLTLIDTPGHPDYLRNAIAGITQADVAVLFADSRPAVLDAAGVAQQTATLYELAGALANARHLVVAVNQLDAAYDISSNGGTGSTAGGGTAGGGEGAAERRYGEAVAALGRQLKGMVRKEGLTFVPLAGYTGDNLVEPSPRLDWWKGPTLLEAVLAAAAGGAAARADPAQPLRMPVAAVLRVGGMGTVAAGRLAGGSVRPGTALCLPAPPSPTAPPTAPTPGALPTAPPSATTASAAATTAAAANGTAALTARSVECFAEGRPGGGGAGEWLGVCVKGGGREGLRRGCVLSEAGPGRARPAAAFTAKLQVLHDHVPRGGGGGGGGEVRPGYCPVLHVHTAAVPCRIASIVRERTKGDGAGRPPDSLRPGEVGEALIVPLRPLVVEPFGAHPHCGRFALRAPVRPDAPGAHAIVAVGRVESVTYSEPPSAMPAAAASTQPDVAAVAAEPAVAAAAAEPAGPSPEPAAPEAPAEAPAQEPSEAPPLEAAEGSQAPQDGAGQEGGPPAAVRGAEGLGPAAVVEGAEGAEGAEGPGPLDAAWLEGESAGLEGAVGPEFEAFAM